MSHLKTRLKGLFGNWEALHTPPKDMTSPTRVSNCIDWKKWYFKIKRLNYPSCFFRFTIKAKVEFYYILEIKRSKYPLSTFLFYFLKLKIIKSFNYLKLFKKIYIPPWNHQITSELWENTKIPQNQGLWEQKYYYIVAG
jgi:hypothetical protein